MAYTLDPTDVIILFILALTIGVIGFLLSYAATSVRHRA
jgi:hypothetical protein